MADDSLQQRLETGVGFREPPIRQIVRPFQEFFRIEASSGIVLIVVTVIALIWANSPWAERYFQLWETEAGIVFGQFHLEMHLSHWINDGLMAIFFFLVGLEIKREILVGELSTPKKALLPIAAAIGGMIFPAAIYLAINAGTEGQAGWGIPMATDIAFALGVLALLGSRVPTSLKIFLAALAIVDDLGAVLVIAVFYTEQVAFSWLLAGAIVFGLMLALNRLGVRQPIPYGLLAKVRGFSRNLRKEVSKNPRYYFFDNGVRNTLIQNFNPLPLRNDIGQLWENFLMVERRKANEVAGRSANRYFWRTYDQKQIAYVEERGGVL